MPNKTVIEWLQENPWVKEYALLTYSKIAALWRPILVDEGAVIPKWYGCSAWIPYPMHNPPMNPVTLQWQKVFYPIPVNVLLALYYRAKFFLRIGCASQPRHWTSKIFHVYETCPDCGRDLYIHPMYHERTESEIHKRSKLMLDLIMQYYTPEEVKKLIGD